MRCCIYILRTELGVYSIILGGHTSQMASHIGIFLKYQMKSTAVMKILSLDW